MLPGKTYTPEDWLRIVIRRKWLILIPFVVVSVGTALVAWKLPNVYKSETLIAVMAQRVPESYVKATVTTKIQERLAAMQQKVLSRTSLERAIQEFDLYRKERRTWMMEDIVQKMATKDIKIEILKADAFRVSYVNPDPRLAQKVTERLAQWFMDESLNDRSALALSTTNFLSGQLDDARRRLEDHERKLAEYKTKHSGELPNELQGNLQVLNNTQLQLQQLNESINRDRDRRFLLEKAIGELSEAPQNATTVVVSGDDPTSVAGGTTAAQLQAAKSQLELLQLRLKPDHPDVSRMKRVIRDLEVKLQAESLERPLSAGGAARPATPEEAARLAKLKAAQTELEMVDRQVTSKQAEEKRLRALLGSYQARVEATAGRESELTGLMRDYDTLKKNYERLLANEEDSKIAANLEDRAVGERFQTLDPPRVPEAPISPNRPLIDLAGAAAGLAIGFGLVAFLEYRDTSFRTDDDVVKVLALPVVAVIPLMLSAAERRTLRRRKVIVGVATAVVVVAALSGGAFLYWRYWM